MIDFYVAGKPAPQGSKKHVGRGILVEASKELPKWRKHVASVAAEAVGEHFQLWEKPIPVSVNLTFILPRPKSMPKSAFPAAVKRPDLDKLARAILDALTGVIYADDSQVIEMQLHKVIAYPDELPGLHAVIKQL